MPRNDYKTCRECHRHADDVGMLSHTRLCSECSVAIENRAALEQHHHHGEFFQRWRHALAASVGAVLLDDAQQGP